MADTSWSYKNQIGLRFNDTFLQLFCEKNSDGTKKLRLKGNELQQRFSDRLHPADMLEISKFLNHHPELTEVDLSYNGIEDEGLETLCHMIFVRPNSLKALNLTFCDLSSVGIKTFYYTAQGNCIELKTLRLCANKLGPQGGHLLALTIPHIPTLEYLDLGDTDQDAESLEYMCMKAYESSVKVLNISRIMPKTNFQLVNTTSLADSISELLQLTRSLVEIHVQKCQLDAHDMETIIGGLHYNQSLLFLDVGYNNICCVGAEFLSKWLQTRPKLLALCIAGNNVRNHGGVALSYGLPFTKLRYLDISYNHIGNDGIQAILTTIKKPYMLRYFLLWGNPFTHSTNKILERMIRSGVFEQRGIDVKIYGVDGVLHAARYPVDKYKHRYYGVMDHGCAVELKIQKNQVETVDDKPRALVGFVHVDRYPEVCRCGEKPCNC